MTHGKKARSASNRQRSTLLKWPLILVAALLIALLLLRMVSFVAHMRRAHDRAANTRQNSATNKKTIAWPQTWTDTFNDGTPDFLRLESPSDQAAFRQWFIAIANFEAGRPKAELPTEISDCAGLLRYCYREALKRHNDSWFLETGMNAASENGLEATGMPGEIHAWQYPETPLAANLFRITPGSFDRATMATDFAQFADAKTLVQRNSFLIGRDLRQAQPGDLLFFRQFEQSSPWHSMIVVSLGQVGGHQRLGVIYHTGPLGHTSLLVHGPHQQPGEIRKVALDELINHPKAEWRPVVSNPNFMGIYRWNILRSEQ
jgi:uncharacterized protein YfaT (DUF1175 family)